MNLPRMIFTIFVPAIISGLLGLCPLPRGEGGPRPAISPASAGRVRGALLSDGIRGMWTYAFGPFLSLLPAS